MADIIQLRRATAANWTATNPVLADGEQGLETDSRKIKTGNGVDTWSVLPYDSGSTGGIPDAPNDGKQYARQSLGWSEVVAGGTTDLSAYQTTAQADAKYQAKGDYLTDAPDDGKNYARKNNGWAEIVASGGTSYDDTAIKARVASLEDSQVIITTDVDISTLLNQKGKNVIIDNGTTPINIICDISAPANFMASFSRLGSAPVTITNGGGVAVVDVYGKGKICNGAVMSSFTLERVANVFYLKMNNV